jgi:hypothetical protein
MSKDIKAIISHLDTYLTRTGQPNIDPVEANAILARAGLLTDSKDRPGKPLRDLLRKGLLPHAFQSGGKGSSWTIPHSNKRTSKTVPTASVVTKAEKPTRVIKTTQVSTVDTSQLEMMLMNDKSFKSAGSIDNLVPHNSGLYCIRISDINKLPKTFNTFLADRQHNIIYIGIATESLNRRFLNQELRANGHGTFFRSIGAVLGHRPPKGSLTTKANKRNYKFSPTDEQKIIKWINDNLHVNWVDFSGDFETLETELINKHRPLINLAKNPSALKELSDLRKICVQIANEQ